MRQAAITDRSPRGPPYKRHRADGPVGEAELIQSFDDYSNLYGDIADENDAMGFAVQSFYLNGGKSAFICRLAGAGSTAASFALKGQDASGSTPDALIVNASSAGEWGNKVYFRIVKPDQDSLSFDLEIGHHDEEGEFVLDEEFQGLTMRAADDKYALSVVNGNSRHVTLSLGDAANPEESTEQFQRAQLTGGDLANDNDFFSTHLTAPMTLGINLNGLGAKPIMLTPASFDTALAGTNHTDDGASVALEIVKAVKTELGLEGASIQDDGDKVALAIQNAVRTLNPGIQAYKDFTCTYTSTPAGSRGFTLTSGHGAGYEESKLKFLMGDDRAASDSRPGQPGQPASA